MQKVYLYNTATRKKEEFKPISGDKVNMFVCGPTVYDYPHLGHAKAYIQFDFIVKYLRSIGYQVFYLQNITNIDDKIIRRSQEQGIDWRDLADQWEKIYMEDMAVLGVTAVTRHARATDYIDQIVKQVKVLLEKGFAYRIDDGIYFEVTKFPDYGKLSGRTEVKEDDGVSRIDENKNKKGWNDFCLWKLSKENEPFWDTELGKGRPGWHIEDTAITETFFGPQYDIHGGGADLIFPHHEAEIAQMEAASGKKPLVRYWMHVGFLNIDSRKMSKSKGNFKTIRQVLEVYSPRVVRWLFLSAHYRSPADFSEATLDQAKNSLFRLQNFVDNLIDEEVTGELGEVEALKEKVANALADDVDTPTMIAAVFDFIRSRNSTGRSGRATREYLVELNKLWGVIDFEVGQIPQEIRELVQKREEARLSQNFVESDKIREEIKSRGFGIEDAADGCKIKKLMLS